MGRSISFLQQQLFFEDPNLAMRILCGGMGFRVAIINNYLHGKDNHSCQALASEGGGQGGYVPRV